MIERIYIHNFRCLQNFELELQDQPSTLLIGASGTGKSTVLQSLRLIQAIGRGRGRCRDLISESDFAQHDTGTPIRFEVDVSLKKKRYRYAIAFEWPSGFLEARILEESLSCEGEPIFSRKQAQVMLARGSSFGLNWHTVALPVIQEPVKKAIPAIKSFFATMVLIAPVPGNMTGYSEAPTDELSWDASNFGAVLRDLLGKRPASYHDFGEHVRAMLPDFASVEHVNRGESGTQLIVKFEQPDTGRTLSLEFKALSDGEKCSFLGAYMLARNAAGPPVFCLWDEPDHHLSLSEVGQFVTSLKKMARHQGQFVATTHHPETVRRFSDETTMVLARRSHLEPTIARKLADIEYQGDLINALIRDEILESP